MEGIDYTDNNTPTAENETTFSSEQRKKTYLEVLKEKNSPKIGEARDVIITQDKPLEITEYRSPQHEENSLKKPSTSNPIATPVPYEITSHGTLDKGKRRAFEDPISPRKKTVVNKEWAVQIEEEEDSHLTLPIQDQHEDDQPDYDDPDT